jgi:hypothetical protein
MKVTNSNYAAVIVSDCLGIQPGEEVVIVTDRNKLAITEDLAYFKTCRENNRHTCSIIDISGCGYLCIRNRK